MTAHVSRPFAPSVADEFVRQRARDERSFNRVIDPRDEMLLFESARTPEADFDDVRLRYFRSGELMLRELRLVVDPLFGGFGKVESLLEFACGYGRFTRFLVQEMPRARIFGSDILTGALDFQREQFGVTVNPSCADPDAFRDARRYQLILVSSLFSHLPRTTFGRWLGRLYELLTEDGVLIFSVHDHASYPASVALDDLGFAFLPVSESATLSSSEYGTAIVSERYVAEAVRHNCPGATDYLRIAKGLWGFQDLYIVARRGGRDLSAAGGGARGPQGYFDHCGFLESAASYCLSGWAFDRDEGSRIDRIEVRVGGDVAQLCLPGHPRLDVAEYFDDPRLAASGWMCLLSSAAVSSEDIVSIEVVADSGRASLLAFHRLRRLQESGSR